MVREGIPARQTGFDGTGRTALVHGTVIQSCEMQERTLHLYTR